MRYQAATRSKWVDRIALCIRDYAHRVEWQAGRFWCRCSCDDGEYLHEAHSDECAAMVKERYLD